MKRIIILSVLFAITTNAMAQVTKHESISLFIFSKPIADKYPGTDIVLGKKKGKKAFVIFGERVGATSGTRYQLVELSDSTGIVKKLVYLPELIIAELKVKLDFGDKELQEFAAGKEVDGYMITAESLGTGSILTHKKKKLSADERRIIEAYRTDEKFIVWSQVPVKVKGTVSASGVIPKLAKRSTNPYAM